MSPVNSGCVDLGPGFAMSRVIVSRRHGDLIITY